MVASYNLNIIHDPLNLQEKRNIRNTCKFDYNCAGYAFRTFSWYRIGTNDDENEEIMGYASKGDYETALALSIDSILNELTGWEEVPIELIQQREFSPLTHEIVLMRFCEFDYHFLRLGRNWNWYDKMGHSSYINRRSFNNGFDKIWNGRYDSPIIAFVRTL